MPRIGRKLMDAAEVHRTTEKPRILKSDGPAKDALEPNIIETADRMPDKDHADTLALNETIVKVRVHDTTDKTATPLPDVYVNGRGQRFIRGMVQDVKWKFVEALARQRETTYTQEQLPNMGGYRNIPHTVLKYPFDLVEAPQKLRDRLKLIMEAP